MHYYLLSTIRLKIKTPLFPFSDRPCKKCATQTYFYTPSKINNKKIDQPQSMKHLKNFWVAYFIYTYLSGESDLFFDAFLGRMEVIVLPLSGVLTVASSRGGGGGSTFGTGTP